MKPGKPLQRRKPLVSKKALQSKKGLSSTSTLQRKTEWIHKPKDRAKRSASTRLRPEAPPNREHMLQVKRLPCLVCLHEGLRQKTPTEAHHIKRDPATGRVLGEGQKAPDEHTIPLCEEHHRTGGNGVAFHAGREPWERAYGNELDMLQETREMLESYDPAA